jgi:hypothetical protein
MNLSTLNQLLDEALKSLQAAPTPQALYDVKVQFLGKNGPLSEVMKEMAKLPKEEKPAFGKAVNEVKAAFEKNYSELDAKLKDRELLQRLASEKNRRDFAGAEEASWKSTSHHIGDRRSGRDVAEWTGVGPMLGWQAQDALGDDVAQYLVGAAFHPVNRAERKQRMHDPRVGADLPS